MLRYIALKILKKYTSKWFVLCIDVLLVTISLFLAYSVRYNINLSFNFNFEHFFRQLPIVVILSIISFLIVGSYKGIIRHTGIRDAFSVFLGTTLSAFFIVIFYKVIKFFNVYESFKISRAIILIHYLTSTFILIFSRFVFKSFFEIISKEVGSSTNVLIYGAGNSGMITYGALTKERDFNILGFIEDDTNKINKKIDRTKIYDSSKINEKFIKENNVDEVIISIQKINSNKLLDITDKFLEFGIHVKIVPPLTSWIDGDLEVNQIKQVNIDDLLGRQQIFIDNPIVKREVIDKVVLVTGAAGSIGSEISRQLATYNLNKLILIDQAESSLYDLQQELLQSGKKNFDAIVADVRDVRRIKEIFEEYKPQKVFHAAAYKHVPLMEQNPYEAIKINILGTKNIADLSVEYEVDRFVMVSTDKAVNPTNVMGATKRVAEIYISCLSKKSNKTKFTTTRFGNVLGSNGSVIPLFKKQIEKGGPLTVTHKDITRYFMTIPEACRLVLEAGTMGVGGEIYIFDMGESVKIFDMAKRMISLSGLDYPKDIDIEIVGLRPGEKLYEELLVNGEDATKTYHEKIMIALTKEIDCNSSLKKINKLYTECNVLKNNEIVTIIKEIVPEYISNNSIYEKLDVIN